MFKIGDIVKIVSSDPGVNKIFINKTGVIDNVNTKSYYAYHIKLHNLKLNEEAETFWWSNENLQLFEDDLESYDDTNEEDAYEKIILTTTNNIDGFRVKKYIDIVSYEYVIGTGPISEFTSGISDFLGERSSSFEIKLKEAKKVSMDKIKLEAYSLGGDAVIGIDLEYASFEGNRIAVIVSGTIVKLEPLLITNA